MEGEQKVSFSNVLADQITISWKKMCFVASYSQTHSDYGPPKMPLKLAV